MPIVESKAAHGKDFQSFVEDGLRMLKRDGYLTQIIREFRAREPGYKNADQYYAPFMLQFNDRTRWILFSTTSMRTDRIKGQQWDADRLKQVDATISKALLVYPDDVTLRVRSEFIRQKNKYDSGWEFTRIDDIVPFGELVRLIKKYDDEIQCDDAGGEATSAESLVSQSVVDSVLGDTAISGTQGDIGRAWDFGGRNFERFIASVLSDRTILSDWRSDNMPADFLHQSFAKILRCIGVDRDDVLSVAASSDKDDIGLLPSGGSPKTDVIATVATRSAGERIFTFSCKRSTKSHVSAHQYSADLFADVLDANNTRLRALLRTFQIYGNKTDFPHEDAVALESELADKVMSLCKWVVGGHGGEGERKQLADYVVAFRVDKGILSVHSTEDYVAKMLNDSNGFFGTPFQWTFASGQRGRSIQLKMPML